MSNGPDSWQSAFDTLDHIKRFAPNHLGLFALALRFRIEDILSAGAESVVDGKNDKKTDIIYIDEEKGVAVIIQCYISSRFKRSAPVRKATDLNASIPWVLQRPLNKVPDGIKPHAERLREGINKGDIRELHIWYVHNLPESKPPTEEMAAVGHTAEAVLKTCFRDDISTVVYPKEVGSKTLAEWYQNTQSSILVGKKFFMALDGAIEIKTQKWSALVTTLKAHIIQDWYRQHKEKLFSANVRDYLGSKDTDSNINNAIKQTASEEPENFWAYNNGLTILVNNFEYNSENKTVEITGVSIVNGAQTTGSLGSVAGQLSDQALVPVRFIKTNNEAILNNLIRFNNSQNKVTASDFRSTDAVQKRLREEMSQLPGVEYSGGRRGGASDAIRRRPQALPSMTVGQALAAVHGDPTIAYNKKSDIWNDSALYSKYFCDKTTAAHIVFCYSLLKCIENKKADLIIRSKHSPDTMTESEEEQLKFMRRRGAIFLLVAAVSECLEIVLARKVVDKFSLSFGSLGPDEAVTLWEDVVDVSLSLSAQLEDAFSSGLQNQKLTLDAIKKFKGVFGATAAANKKIYSAFAKQLD